MVLGVSFSDIFDFIQEFFDQYGLRAIDYTIPVTINLNNVVYHGVPGEGFLKGGDVVTVDVCFSFDGVKIDGASTFIIGDIPDLVRELVSVSKAVVVEVSRIVDVGVSVKAILRYLSDYISNRGFYLLPHGMGHGIGAALHEVPFLSLNDFSDFNYIFKKGDVFTIEPIVLLHQDDIHENLIGEGVVDSENISSQFEITLFIEDIGIVHILNAALLN